tara:strand:- start:415 stop:552 length:138 start_codon:yes stop_codon:yes gene_type:complete
MKELLYKLNKWFELNIGWFFINGNKALVYEDYLKEKYFTNKNKRK